MHAAVIIPTYNERENIEELVDEILRLPEPPAIFIVDDNSPDGTGELADALARERRHVYVRHRPAKLGLGTAHIAGFKDALVGGYQYILTMDADFSHHPQYIPDLIGACHDHDVVIGSRYVKGGGTRYCRLRRRILSRTGNFVARVVLGLPAYDCTAGFRCYRRRVVESIDLNMIFADGYSFLIEMLCCVQIQDFRIGEVPIIYEDRWQGRSKISRQEIVKAMYTVLRLGWSLRVERPMSYSRAQGSGRSGIREL
ncbi:MAG: polyprenol monophosphomannose synthase [Anaerolineae bacterium]